MPATRKLSLEKRREYISLRRTFLKPVIGITGNLGKTSTLEMIRSVLEVHGTVLKNHHGYGNWKNNINTLERLDKSYDFALFEFDYQRGNHFAEILRLIKPTIGIVTNIGESHLNYLSSIINIVLEKSAVVKYLARDGLAILNQDDELTSSIVEYISTRNVVKFGLNNSADFYASDIQQCGPEGLKFKLNGRYRVQMPFFSIQDVYNFLAATACCVNLGFHLDEILDHFQDRFSMPAGRGKLHKIGSVYVLDESYIATPRSLSKAARSLIGFKPYTKKLFLIIGDMTNAGINVEDQHLNMGYFLSALPIDYLITVGEYARFIGRGASLIKTRQKKIFSVNSVDEILSLLDVNLGDQAAIAVKGVGSVAMHRILKYLNGRESGK